MRITQGTISVAGGGTVVTGTGTAWLSDGIVPGMSIFTVDVAPTHRARVARIAADGLLHLAEPWTGGTQTGATYAISVDFTPFGLPLIDETAVELPVLWNAAFTRIEARLAELGAPVTSPLPRIDELSENVPEAWNSALDEIEARLADLGVST